MHELSLFGHVSPARHEQLLNILAGVCAMQPRRVLQRRVLCKPAKAVKLVEQQVGGSQVVQQQKKAHQSQKQPDAFYKHLVQGLDENDFGNQINHVGKVWVEEFNETPDPGVKSHVLRQAYCLDANVITDPHSWLASHDYKFVNEYVLDGHRYVWRHVDVLLYRNLLYPSPSADIRAELPGLSELMPLDPSGGYVLKATVRLGSGTNPKLRQLGQRDLDNFRDRLKGVVEMKVPDRLCLDTRVK